MSQCLRINIQIIKIIILIIIMMMITNVIEQQQQQIKHSTVNITITRTIKQVKMHDQLSKRRHQLIVHESNQHVGLRDAFQCHYFTIRHSAFRSQLVRFYMLLSVILIICTNTLLHGRLRCSQVREMAAHVGNVLGLFNHGLLFSGLSLGASLGLIAYKSTGGRRPGNCNCL